MLENYQNIFYNLKLIKIVSHMQFLKIQIIILDSIDFWRFREMQFFPNVAVSNSRTAFAFCESAEKLISCATLIFQHFQTFTKREGCSRIVKISKSSISSTLKFKTRRKSIFSALSHIPKRL